ncbi:hypothetical protein, partial [Pedobacter jeongneungensis]|uniref:hypothetical protein n=1 Tax=Pedobacter jeongneungensis TaxID=947309 RepID=UPI001963CAC4
LVLKTVPVRFPMKNRDRFHQGYFSRDRCIKDGRRKMDDGISSAVISGICGIKPLTFNSLMVGNNA